MLKAVKLKYYEMFLPESLSLPYEISTIIASPMTFMNPVDKLTKAYARIAYQKSLTTVPSKIQQKH